ncbi:MAG: dihydropteroate synthase [Acidobacteria bacterium]|nr:MAG: dihydropteroate synthase [Acidobacteriota bacterium]
MELGRRTLIMGVLNVTPDSFSDGGEFFSPHRAIERALAMEAEGADIIDIGGESTRPGARPVSVEEELDRVMPVIESLVGRVSVPLSIDTRKYEVARRALRAGVEILNDVSGLRQDIRLADLAGQWGAALIIMNMRGRPETMQKIPPSPDIFAEIEAHFEWAVAEATTRGVAREQLLLDPGIGFGKTVEQNCALINHLDRFARFNLPLMIGTSRKTFIGKILDKPPEERLMGTAASVVAAIFRGVHIVRVHDVREMKDVVAVADAILNASGDGC